MRKYLQGFFEEFDYPVQAREILTNAYDAICACSDLKGRFNALIAQYRADIHCNFSHLLAEMQAVGEEAGIHEYTAKLLLCICLSERLKAHFIETGLGAELWRDAMCDLRYKLIECHLVYGIWGSFVCSWFKRFFNATRFALGRLQFETIRFRKSYQKNGVTLHAESTVINVHIPRTGGRLLPDEVKDSYRQAAEFFKERYHLDKIIFVCDSWLLYPPNAEVLSEHSNLRQFISDYDIIEWAVYPNYAQVWRLFDRNFDGDVDQLPQDSSLRRAYADWIRKGIPTGNGYGVYVYG
jgi:hypothetical protein